MILDDSNLSPCQKQALEVLHNKGNVFLTGVAGSGKSFLLQEYLKNKERKTHPIVASTGTAAILVRGVTFHSFFGLGIMEGGVENTVVRALKDSRLKKRLKETQQLIIDEVSMIPGQAMDAAEIISRKIRGTDEPWGGIRIVAVGDFGQLPPVNPHRNQNRDWAFLSESWSNSQFQVAYLKTVMRSQDVEFLEVLNFVREGQVNAQVRDFLNSKLIKVKDKFEGTILFPHRQTVEDYNLKQLEELSAPVQTFPTSYTGAARFLDQIKKTAPVPEVLHLKKNALVMIRKNDPQLKYVNGSVGHLVGIGKDELTIKLLNGRSVALERESFGYMNAEGEEVAAASNFPVNLAWATTIHKSQGTTLDVASMDLSRVFEDGQAYVALSRVRTSSGLYLSGWNTSSIRVSQEVKTFHQKILN